MSEDKKKMSRRHLTRMQIDAARADLYAKGKLPPKGTETGIYCWCAFFAGSFFSKGIFTEWGWGAIMILFFGAAYFLGQKADNEYDELVEAHARRQMQTSD
ncbi:MAG: hypothetical protein WA790_05945 [Sulfitobacter sp.]